ncbi:hypothetical protein LTR78_001481 [Recurvomyces mirabilis]|uniref:Rhodopsin domain-containing protein n=1 Tax=Recurvomyces mirabilis TaxID=574656 RepID=A0AAE0WVM4_9PEZI|nr:hypothetical protein LTR78_001481 [Recurvomyces mirabilis]
MTFLEGSIGWDDWTILLAFVLLIPSNTLVQLMTRHGLGQDVWNVLPDDIDKIFFYFYVGEYFYFAVIVVTKVSIILLYLRIFPSSISARFRTISYTIIGLLIAYWLAITLALALQCRPVHTVWQAWDGEHEGKCLNVAYIVYISTALNISFDLVVILLPIPKLAKLQVRDTRKKVGVILTFLIGLFVTVCSIIRLLYLTQWGSLSNFTYHYNAIGLWSGIECDVGVFCACMPTVLGPVMYFFRERVPSMGSHTRSKEASRAESRIRRLPSSASEHEAGGQRDPKDRSWQKVYDLRYEQRSADVVEMIAQDPLRTLRTTGPLEMARSNPGGYRHEYADQWR